MNYRALKMISRTLEHKVYKIHKVTFIILVENGHLTLIKKLLEIVSPSDRERVIHAKDNLAFYQAVTKGRLAAVEMLIELTPDPVELKKMINSLKEHRRFQFSSLEVSQYLLSFALDLKPTILNNAINRDLRKRIQDSDSLVQKLIEIREEHSAHSVMKFFEYIKYGKSVFNIILTGKTFITYLQNLGIFDSLLDYIGDQDVSLTRKEKVWVLNALASHAPNLEDTRNPQDKKVSFVERVLAQKAASQARFILSAA